MAPIASSLASVPEIIESGFRHCYFIFKRGRYQGQLVPDRRLIINHQDLCRFLGILSHRFFYFRSYKIPANVKLMIPHAAVSDKSNVCGYRDTPYIRNFQANNYHIP